MQDVDKTINVLPQKKNKHSALNGMLGGRPRAIKSVEDMENSVKKYLEHLAMNEGMPFTLTGLAFFMGVDAETLTNYGKDPRFFGIWKDIKRYLHMQYENGLLTSTRPVAYMFALKNHFGWRDEKNVNITQVNISGVLSSLDREKNDPEIIQGEIVDSPQEIEEISQEA